MLPERSVLLQNFDATNKLERQVRRASSSIQFTRPLVWMVLKATFAKKKTVKSVIKLVIFQEKCENIYLKLNIN